ncbi:bifunctional preprotein translocase subunit SecD/SecF [Gracilibacillus halophilus YIM-C55.5]|uniref:Multifunctional fusion protein n=1 Tax=Gracilibacillus halophilus YIM-C55.5 TaxID=1308866 RepID=N4W9Z1_9BACI|nr:protein translocase subunit SecDF [Gracilibacillus halophilus]ENH97093.1 bifunctional preprotein translocase subunit SecD/SecF [Gracilibacillus halophilus YIM-C55.5]
MVKKGRIIAFFLIVIILGATIGTTYTNIAKNINLGLDLQGGFEVLYTAETIEDGEEVTTKNLESTTQILRERVDSLGISEPRFNIEEPNRIRVQLPGVEDQEEARDLLSTSASLSFRDVNDKEYLDGSDIVNGSAQQDFSQDTNQPIVTVQFKDADRFGDATREIMNDQDLTNQIVIWMDYEEGDSYQEEVQKEDPKFISAPTFTDVLQNKSIQIEGPDFTVDSAQRLADILNAGSLPVNLEEEYSRSVGAQFGQQALDKTIFASVIGIILIFAYMILYYRFPGMIAAITLSIYVYLVLLVFELMNGVLTLPGIAALVLGVGMAVDANIITYERIKEELKEGKSIKAAFRTGNQHSLSTIIDANITTLIAAAVLFIFGTSSVKGFATLLIVSIVLSFVTAVFGSRLFLGFWVNSHFLNKRPGFFGVKKHQIKDINSKEEVQPTVFGRQFDFVGHRKKFFRLSLFLVALGIICLAVFRLNLGIDFVSGSRIEVLADRSLTTEEIENAYDELGMEPSTQVAIQGDDDHIAVTRFEDDLSKDKIAEVQNYFEEKYGNTPTVNTVSPIVGQELAQNAILAVLYASIGIIIYVTIRFEFYSALTAILALLHDAFFIVALFAITRIEFDITIIAAILTIVGYSINDTIVTFDRIRENMKKEKRIKSFAKLAGIINRSLMQTLARSINTVLTVIFAATMLLIFGASAITNFSFALVVGLLAGTYSSLFIAAQVWLAWRGKTVDEKPIDYREKKANDGPQV